MKTILDPRICSFLDEPRGDRRAVPIFSAGNCETKPFDGNREPYLVCACGLHGDTPQFYSATQCRECREKEMRKCTSVKTQTAASLSVTSASQSHHSCANGPSADGRSKTSQASTAPSPSLPKESNVGKRMKLSDMPVGTIFINSVGDECLVTKRRGL